MTDFEHMLRHGWAGFAFIDEKGTLRIGLCSREAIEQALAHQTDCEDTWSRVMVSMETFKFPDTASAAVAETLDTVASLGREHMGG